MFLAIAALIGIFLNQLAFSYAIKLTTATTVALLFGTLPALTGLFAFALGIERFGPRFWLAAAAGVRRRRAGRDRLGRRRVGPALG